MAESFGALLIDLAVQIGVDPDGLARTQELIVGDTVVGMYLDAADDDNDAAAAIFDRADDRSNVFNQQVIFFTLLGTVDHQHFPRIARTLLEANNLWAGTAGCTLGLQRGSNQVILAGQLSLHRLEGPNFSVVLDGFCDTANFWREFVAGANLEDIARPAPLLLNMA